LLTKIRAFAVARSLASVCHSLNRGVVGLRSTIGLQPMIDEYTISLWKAWYWTLNPSDDNKQSVLQSCKDVLKDPSQVVEKLYSILHEYSMTKFTGSS
jgi:hypothetical protein